MKVFQKNFPYLKAWVESYGELQLGTGYMTTGLLRLFDEGGNIWIDEESDTIDEALFKAEKYLKKEFENDFGYKIELD